MKVITIGSPEAKVALDHLSSRRVQIIQEYGSQVDQMYLKYHAEREEALLQWAREHDGLDLDPSELWVDEKFIKSAHRKLPSDVREAIEHAISRIERFQKELTLSSFQTNEETGVFWGTEVRPLDRIGIYVPGGRANYFATLLLCAVPARMAGVKEIVVATPPRKRVGKPYVEPSLLYAAKLFGISKILLAGGVGGLSGLAFGTSTSEPVQKIVGSGNKRTVVAKMRLSGLVGVDGLTGPSETAFLCNESTSVRSIAADILGRADRDAEAEVFIFQSSRSWVEELIHEIASQLENLKDSASKVAVQKCLENNTHIFISKNFDQSIQVCNLLAPGVVCLNIDNPENAMDKIQSCGILLMGPYTPPVSLDLIGGPSGLVPTLGSAAYTVSMSPAHFMRRFPVVEFDQNALERFQQEALEISEEEGFSTHEAAYKTRLNP